MTDVRNLRLVALLVAWCIWLPVHAAGVWNTVAPMNAARSNHTATKLDNGMVLVVGGSGVLVVPNQDPTKPSATYYPSINSAELYDPTTKNWRNAVGNMNYPREQHTATLLPRTDAYPQGSVLVVGGLALDNNGTITQLKSAELYDVATGRWITTGSMQYPRYGHTATLLASGKVLVVGGNDTNSVYFKFAELYDPTAKTWSVVTYPMPSGCRYHTATMLADNNTVLIAGGYGDITYMNAVQLYDSSTGKWTSAPSLNNARTEHVAALIGSQGNQKVIVANGYNYYDGGYIRRAELYDGTAWNYTIAMAIGRESPSAVVLHDGSSFMIMGGVVVDSGPATTSTVLYSNNSWTGLGNLNVGRYYHTATLLDNSTVLVTGGLSSSSGNFRATALNSAELFDPGPGVPVVLTDPATVTATAVTLNGHVDDDGADTTVTFEYGATTAYGITVSSLNPGPSAVAAGKGNTAIAHSLSGLSCSTTYHYRVNGANSVGTKHGADQSFTTASCPPTATTTAANLITTTSATLHGTVNSNGNSVVVSFDFGSASKSYGFNLTATLGADGSSASANVSGLDCNTTYYYQIKAALGTTTTISGGEKSFATLTTPACSPAGGSADCNADGKVNSLDLICVANNILGL